MKEYEKNFSWVYKFNKGVACDFYHCSESLKLSMYIYNSGLYKNINIFTVPTTSKVMVLVKDTDEKTAEKYLTQIQEYMLSA